jgi:hypothetical protein
VPPARSVLIVVVLLSVCNMRGVDDVERSRLLAAIAATEAAIASADAEAAGLRHAANVELARVMHEAIEAGASPLEVARLRWPHASQPANLLVRFTSSHGFRRRAGRKPNRSA